MPLDLPEISEANLDLDLIAERLEIGDSVQFVTKMTSFQQKAELAWAGIYQAVQDINAWSLVLEALDINSSYDVAVQNGYGGTAAEWLLTLIGPDGPAGPSAYDLAVTQGYAFSLNQWLFDLQGTDGLNGYPGTGAGYVAPPWGGLSGAELDALTPYDPVITDLGGYVTFSDNAIRYDWGSVADIAARDLIANPQHGDYVSLDSEGGEYHYYSEKLGDWVDTGSTILPIVPANADLDPSYPSTSWNVGSPIPQVDTASDLDGVDWGLYPNGVFVSDIGKTAYRNEGVDLAYQHLCSTSATPWLGRGWVTDGGSANQATRVQAEVTADTYAKFGFQIGSLANSYMVEIQPTQIQAYENDVAVGAPITVSIGDIIGLFRYANGQLFLNINSVNVYTFPTADIQAFSIYAYLFGLGDCLNFAMSGVDVNLLDPIQWDGFTDADMTEVIRAEAYRWSTELPEVTNALADNRMKIVNRQTTQKPELGGWLNVYPDGGVAGVTNLSDGDVFTILVSPSTTTDSPGETITADAGWDNREPYHFGMFGVTLEQIGSNGL